MIPSIYVRLKEFPLTSSGKIDRKALPIPSRQELITKQKYIAPRNAIEKTLVDIWSEILNIKHESIFDNFFYLGGDSLVATKIISRIRHIFNIDCHIHDLFEHPFIAKFAAFIQRQLSGTKVKYEPIKPISRKPPLLLSFAQQRLWFLNQYEETKRATYNIPLAIEMTGHLNLSALTASINYLMQRHESLRTRFKQENGKPQQEIVPTLKLTLIPISVAMNQLSPILSKEAQQGFDLTAEPLIRVKLFSLAKNKHVLLIVQHHIISDGWSLGIFIKELIEIYNAFVVNSKPKLPKLSIQYVDYAYWQKKWLTAATAQKQLDYWLKKLDGITDLDLPTDYSRPKVKTYNGHHYKFRISKIAFDDLKKVAYATNTTLFMALLTTFYVFLKHYSGQENIVIGSPIANRNQSAIENIIGFFVNTLALRIDLSNNPKFIDLLAQVKKICLEAYANQDIPFEHLVDKLKVTRDVSRNPIFQVMFVLQNANEQVGLDFTGIKAKYLPIKYDVAIFDLTFELVEIENELNCTIQYNTDLYKSTTIKRMAEHFKIFLSGMAANLDMAFTSLPTLTPSEYKKILIDWNRTEKPYPSDKTVHELFAEQVENTPNNIAVIFEDQKLTYRELNNKSNQLAHIIRKQYIARYNKPLVPDTLIGICSERCIEMIIGILAVLKAGGAYVPLDSSYPQERLELMVKDTQIKILLMQKRLLGNLLFLTKVCKEIIFLESEELYKFGKISNKNPKSINTPHNLAYIIYTSGSTGIPKGVMIEHLSVINLVHFLTKRFYKKNIHHVAQFSSICFDASVLEIWSTLVTGSTLYIVSEDARKDYFALSQFLVKYKIDIILLPPAVLKNFPKKYMRFLATLFVGGDVCDLETMQYWSKGRLFINAYGPTESTVCASLCVYDKTKLFNQIGKPIDNIKLYALDKYLNPVPIGVLGELYIGGEGLARGYLNQPELTEEKFLENPFITSEEKAHKKNLRLYKTGDIVKWLEDGSLAFLGRKDYQVKIRGFRIELGEIESVLMKYQGISQCVVIAYEEEDQKRLVAYYTLKDKKGKPIAVEEMRSFLGKHLPDYMLPTVYVHLKSLPLTTTGKTDRKALPKPEINILIGEEYIPPRNSIERALVDIWSDILKVRRISIDNNFFNLGGHSLKATQVTARIKQIFKIECPVRAIFEHSDIESLALFINNQLSVAKLQEEPILPVSRDQPLMLSFAQQRLWFLDQYEQSKRAVYNIPLAVHLIGPLNILILEKSLNFLIVRHEAFRTLFKNIKGKPFQVIIPEYHLHLKAITTNTKKLNAQLKKEAIKPFDLTIGPLIRTKLFKLANNNYILVINQHHIISDGWSLSIFTRELNELYKFFLTKQSPKLPDLSVQYIDFIYWQQKWLTAKILQKQLSYWKKKLDNFSDLNLPTDFPRPPIQTYNGKHYQFLLDKTLVKKLTILSLQTKTTLFILLLTAFNILLSLYSGQEDIVIGSPIANRNHPMLENIIGFFVNTLSLRSDLSGNPRFIELLEQVKNTCLEAYSNQDVPFEYLIDALNVKRDVSRSPIFQVMFILQNIEEKINISFPNIKTQKINFAYDVAKFDLTFVVYESQITWACEIEYNTDLYKSSTIHRMAKHFYKLLQSIVDDPTHAIFTLPILTSNEYKKTLIDWNRTEKPYPSDKTVHELFAEQVENTPNNIAVVFKDQKLTYRELNNKSNQLAHIIRKQYKARYNKSLVPDTLIGLCSERCIEMIIGILAVLKAGGAYVPLDPSYPQERLELMAKDTQIKILLMQKRLLGNLLFLTKVCKEIIFLESEELYKFGKISNKNPKSINTPRNLAYIIYTSGSTGIPKGVMIEHLSVINLSKAHQRYFQIGVKDRVIQFASIHFDASVSEIFATLLKGACLDIIDSETRKDAAGVYEYLVDNKISVASIPPILLRVFPKKYIKGLKTLIVAGDICDLETMRYWSKGRLFINGYGPTESTVCASLCIYDKTKLFNQIGKPIDNIKLYVLDKYLNPVPIGVLGELYIGGEGLARGYLNQPKLTEEKFIENPFITSEEKTHKKNLRLYKTGDLVKWLEDGSLVFLGRKDYQVKIRGFRIELGEIESVLLKYSKISQCIVIAYEEEDQKRLVAYYTLKDKKEKPLAVEQMRSFLGKHLPDYMLPAVYVHLKSLPLTTTGKIDRKALPKPEIQVLISKKRFIAPRNEIEKALVNIWTKILRVKKVSIYDDFFALGGNSLLAVQLVFAINEKFNTNLAISTLFKASNIAKLSVELKPEKKEIAKIEEF